LGGGSVCEEQAVAISIASAASAALMMCEVIAST
jgi:hypothetical protein